MTRLTGTILFSLALSFLASTAVAGDPSAYTLTPAQPTNKVYVQPTPTPRVTQAQPQLGEIIYGTSPTQVAPAQEIINIAPSAEPFTGSAGYAIEPVQSGAQ